MKDKKSNAKNQGEGNREADQRYRKTTRDFVKAGKVAEAAANARDQNEKEGIDAEKKGRERAKEYDPSVKRDYQKS